MAIKQAVEKRILQTRQRVFVPVRTRLINPDRIRYRVFSEKGQLEDVGEYVTYGLQVGRLENGRWIAVDCIHDVTVDYHEAFALAQRFQKCRLSAEHLRDAVEDLLP